MLGKIKWAPESYDENASGAVCVDGIYEPLNSYCWTQTTRNSFPKHKQNNIQIFY